MAGGFALGLAADPQPGQQVSFPGLFFWEKQALLLLDLQLGGCYAQGPANKATHKKVRQIQPGLNVSFVRASMCNLPFCLKPD